MTDEEFNSVIEESIELLPQEFKDHLDDVEIVVEDLPNSSQQGRMRQKYKTDRPFVLLGLYEGVPVGKKSVFAVPVLPARITLFRKTIEKFCGNREEMVDQINRTLLHEIGHHFGISDRELRNLGF